MNRSIEKESTPTDMDGKIVFFTFFYALLFIIFAIRIEMYFYFHSGYYPRQL